MSTQNSMIPLDNELLNSPERILTELLATKQKINTLKSLESVLKDELEQHKRDGRIKGIFKHKGITANRLQTKQKYKFSEQLREKESTYLKEIEELKELEVLDNKAEKLETTSYWRITYDK